MELFIELQDNADVVHNKFRYEFNSEDTLEQLNEKIYSKLKINNEDQQLFLESGKEFFGVGDESIQSFGLQHGGKVIVKHADLPWWNLYKKCVEMVLKHCSDKVAIAKRAIQHHERLMKSGFFDVYAEFEEFRSQQHSKVASWTVDDDDLIRRATEQYFHNLHDQNRGNEESEFICYFEERDAELGGRSTNTLAFVRIHGADSDTKYNVKCHYYGYYGSDQIPDITEFYCYELLALIGVAPKSHIIPPSTSTGTKTNTYIATQWDDRFELLESVIDDNSLCGDVVVQLVMLRVLLFINDLHGQNCGRWKGTKHAAIVDFAPAYDFKVYPDIKSAIITTFPNYEWKKEYSTVKNQHDDNSWLKIAKLYLDKWDLSSKIELAREQVDPTKDLLKRLEIGLTKRQLRYFDSPTDELNDYIDTLYKNLENLQTLLNSIV